MLLGLEEDGVVRVRGFSVMVLKLQGQINMRELVRMHLKYTFEISLGK